MQRRCVHRRPDGRRRSGVVGVRVVGPQGQHAADPLRRHPGTDQLVGVLGRRAQRDHQERRVAVERDQLTGADPPLHGVPRPEPDHDDHEHPGQEHLQPCVGRAATYQCTIIALVADQHLIVQVPGYESCRETIMTQQLHEQPRAVAARAASLGKRFFRRLNARLHADQVFNAILDRLVQAKFCRFIA